MSRYTFTTTASSLLKSECVENLNQQLIEVGNLHTVDANHLFDS
jgi:hypothetical protein